MIPFSEAQQLVIKEAKSFGKERVLLDAAVGRVLAETITADRNYPPFNRATMDGYAIAETSWKKGIRKFKIVETIYAGKESINTINQDECYKIMTGASVPDPANVVIRKEDAVEENGFVSFTIDAVKPFQSIAKEGEDLKEAETISSKQILCNAALIGVLAAIGRHEVMVEALPKVSIITTGDEVIAVDSNVKPVQIRNSNSHVLKALLKKWDIEPVACKHVPDDKKQLENILSKSLSSDIIILSGAVSAGDADFVPEVLEKMGAKKIFHKTAIRPGRPIWFGEIPNGPIVFGLPGNPFSCIVTFKLFIEVFLSCSFGLGVPPLLALPLNSTRKKNTALDEFFPIRISGSPSVAEPLQFNTSGDITAAINADAIAHHPIDIAELSQGTIISCYKLF